MPRRRLNTKFLVALVSVVGAGGVGAFVVKKYAFREHPDRYVAAGQQEAAAGHWDRAIDDFRAAAALDPHNPDLLVNVGNVTHAAIAAGAVERRGQDVAAYKAALDVKPDDVAALKALCGIYQEGAQFAGGGQAELYTALRDYADRWHKADPSDVQAEALLYLATVEGWLNGVSTEDKRVDAALSAMRDLMARDPADTELPYFLALAKIKRGQEINRAAPRDEAQPASATAMFADARSTFDAPLKSHDSAMMRFRSSQVALALAGADRYPGAAANDRARALADLDRAAATAKVDDHNYVQIQFMAAVSALQAHDTPRAVKILRDTVAAKPQDQFAKLKLGQVLAENPATRDEAIGVFDAAMSGSAAGSLYLDEVRCQILAFRADLRLNAYAESVDPAERAKLLDAADKDVTRLREARGDSPDVVRLTGRSLLAQGKAVEAIQQLTKAASGNAEVGNDPRVLKLLAESYARFNQTGKARDYLKQVIARDPGALDARVMLCQLLMVDDRPRAMAELATLEKAFPDDPRVLTLRIQTLDPSKDADRIRAGLDKLPGATVTQLVQKSAVAQLALKDNALAAKFLEQASAKDPNSLIVSMRLSEVYLNLDQKDQAKAVLQKAAAAHPDNDLLKLQLAQLDGNDPAKLLALRRQLVDQTSDPLSRELKYADLAQSANDSADYEKHLRAAEAVAPRDPRVCEAMFNLLLRTRRFDEAEKYIDRLAAVDRDQSGGLSYRYQVALAKGDGQGALDVARQMTQNYGDFSTAWLALGEAYQNLGRYQDAIDQYTIALQKQANPAAMNAIAQCDYKLGKTDDALRELQQGLARFPNNAPLRDALIEHQVNYGTPAQAAAILEQQAKQQPDNLNIAAALLRARMRVADDDAAAGRADAAVKSRAAARALATADLAKWPDAPDLYALATQAALSADDAPAAEQTLKTWAARPAWAAKPDPQIALALFYTQTAKLDAAESAYRTAMSVSGNTPGIEVQLARFLAEHGKLDDALALVSSLNADQPVVRRTKIGLLLAANHPADAFAALDAALAQNPPDAADLQGLYAQLMMRAGKPAAALDHANAGLALQADQPICLLFKGQALLAQQPTPDVDGAVAALTSARDHSPKNPEIRLTLGQAYLLKKDQDAAVRELLAGLRLDPSNKPVRMKLVQLYGDARPPRTAEALALLDEVMHVPPYDKDADVPAAEAYLYRASGDLSRAADASLEAQKRSPGNPNLFRGYLDILLADKQGQAVLDATANPPAAVAGKWFVDVSRGRAQKLLGNDAAALAEFERALAAAAADNDAAAVSTVLSTLTNEVGVEQAIAAVTDKAANNATARLVLALLYHQKGDEDRALGVLRPIMADLSKLSVNEQRATLGAAARIYASARPHPMADEAYDAYKKLIDLAPEDMAALNNMACLLSDTVTPPRPQEALGYAQRAVDVMNRSGQVSPLVLDTQGWLLVQTGNPEQGVSVLQQVVGRQPFPEAYYHLGEGYLRLNLVAEAQKQVVLAQAMIERPTDDGTPADPGLVAKIKDLNTRCGLALKQNANAAP